MSYNCPLRAFCNGLCRVAPPKRGIFWRFQVHVYERVGISPVEVCDLKGLGNLSSRYNVKGLKMAYKRVLWLGKKVQLILDFSKKKKMFARHPGFHNFRALSSFQFFLELNLLVHLFLYFLMSVLDVSVFILYSFNNLLLTLR